MAKRNGWFGLKPEKDGTYLQLVPPAEGGEPIQAMEVAEYLHRVKVEDYDMGALNQAIKTLKEPTVVLLTLQAIPPVHELSKVEIAADRMTAVIRLYPPSKGGAFFDRKELLGELTHAGIKYGIQEAVVNYLTERPVFGQDFVVAKGLPAQEGTNASIEYHFDTAPKAKPKLNEDGTVDFHQLNIFTKVNRGQLLATLTPEQPGTEGQDVMGNRILPRKVQRTILRYGRNIRLSEDQLQIFSEVNGDVRLEGDTVYVSDTFTVAADVDTSTGDIVYEGNVVVNGNVRTGFRIRAEGDIQVKGVVEGADLYAGGNIVLGRGIQGMNRGRLEAGGDIVTRFIESASVKAGQTIHSGSILHSQVEAGDTILCEGKKSFIIGGSINALNLIEAKSIGNQMGTVTNVKLGVDASVLEQLKELQKESEKNAETIEKCTQILLLFKKRIAEGQKITPDKAALIRSAGADRKQLEERQEELNIQMAEIRRQIEANMRGRLRVSGTIYPGAVIQIGNNQHVIRKEQKYCQFCLRDGEIKAEGYS